MFEPAVSVNTRIPTILHLILQRFFEAGLPDQSIKIHYLITVFNLTFGNMYSLCFQGIWLHTWLIYQFSDQVLVHTSYMLPLAGTKVHVPTVAGSRTRLAVVPEVTVTTPEIRQLSPDERKCVFPDEQRLRLHHVYTKSACLSECRNKYIMLVCRCKLYFFTFRGQNCSVLSILISFMFWSCSTF